MFILRLQRRFKWLKSVGTSLVGAFYVFVTVIPIEAAGLDLPPPGVKVALSPIFSPSTLLGITLSPNEPLHFNFLVNTGDQDKSTSSIEQESAKLVKYFLASLTVPEKDLWVNLSPYEKDRVIPQGFGVTQMGRDLLVQDYLLKQVTSSLMGPEDPLGKKFWDKVYAKAEETYGTTDIPLDMLHKVWIVPAKAVVYESQNSAFVVKSRLKVLLEKDYLAGEEAKGKKLKFNHSKNKPEDIQTNILRAVLIPEIEKEVNEGKKFSSLRQIYASLILATWFKRKFKETVLGKTYFNQNKIEGVDIADKRSKEKIYKQYLQVFKTGVYNYIQGRI